MLILISPQYANVMGIAADLKLSGNDYTNASSAFWIAVVVCEVPNGLSLQVTLFLDGPH